MKSKETEYRAHYNPDRECYISADGKFICYETWDPDQKKKVTFKIEVGKDEITEELTFLIDEMNHQEDLNDRYENELKDPLFEKKQKTFSTDSYSDNIDPWDAVSRSQDGLDYEQEPEDPDLAKIRKVVDEELTDAQRDLYYEHFGRNRQLEDIRREEVVITGKEKSLQSVLNRKNKIIRKVAHKAFGVEPVKRHNYPKKEG